MERNPNGLEQLQPLKAINSDMGMYPKGLPLPTAVFVLGVLLFYEKLVIFSV